MRVLSLIPSKFQGSIECVGRQGGTGGEPGHRNFTNLVFHHHQATEKSGPMVQGETKSPLFIHVVKPKLSFVVVEIAEKTSCVRTNILRNSLFLRRIIFVWLKYGISDLVSRFTTCPGSSPAYLRLDQTPAGPISKGRGLMAGLGWRSVYPYCRTSGFGRVGRK
jgi:hypothetical protein